MAGPGDASAIGAPIDWRRLMLPAACFTAGCAGAAAALMLFAPEGLEWVVPVVCWLSYPIVGSVVLDVRPTSGLGQLLCLLGIVPLMIAVYATTWAGGQATPAAADVAARDLTGPFTVALLVAVPLYVLPTLAHRRAVLLLAGTGAALSLAGAITRQGQATGQPPALLLIGWVCIAVSVAAVMALLVSATRTGSRQAARPGGWLAILVLAASISLGLGFGSSTWMHAYVTAGAIFALPICAALIHLTEDFPPPGEVALNTAVILTWVGAVTSCFLGVQAWADAVDLPDPASAATVAGALVAVGLIPALLSLRREALIRSYGSVRMPSRMMSELTSRIRDGGDPRRLLDVAAQAAADAVRSPSAAITLGADEPTPAPSAAVLPLLIGGDRVGSLVIEPRRAGQPLERRDLVVLEGLAVPVALVARAVALAVSVEHARQDERRRVRTDLHDGLGPILAGLSMRVTGARRMAVDNPTVATALASVGDGLAEGRAELRRIVAGLAPSKVVDGDLPHAVRALVDSLRPLEGPTVDLHIDTALAGVEPSVATAAYRTVAESLTNVLRHADASHCVVDVLDVDDHVLVQVSDDGCGLPADRPTGVGLGSLRDRATALGGRLDILARPGGGTTVRATLPKAVP